MKTYGGMELYLHAFLNLAVYLGEALRQRKEPQERPRRESNHSPQYDAEVKNGWAIPRLSDTSSRCGA
jgi:hypothetical protein